MMDIMSPVTHTAFASWIALYEELWRTPDTAELHRLFAPDATYRHSPYAEPVVGLAAIARDWEQEREGPDEPFEMTAEIIAVDGDTGVARVAVTYGPPEHQEYLDLWLVKFNAAGTCVSFEEWPFWPDQPWASDDELG
jgi:hypothetical protein